MLNTQGFPPDPIFHKVATNAKLRTSEGEEFEVNNYITTLRKKSVTIVTRR